MGMEKYCDIAYAFDYLNMIFYLIFLDREIVRELEVQVGFELHI